MPWEWSGVLIHSRRSAPPPVEEGTPRRRPRSGPVVVAKVGAAGCRRLRVGRPSHGGLSPPRLQRRYVQAGRGTDLPDIHRRLQRGRLPPGGLLDEAALVRR